MDITEAHAANAEGGGKYYSVAQLLYNYILPWLSVTFIVPLVRDMFTNPFFKLIKYFANKKLIWQ